MQSTFKATDACVKMPLETGHWSSFCVPLVNEKAGQSELASAEYYSAVHSFANIS